MRKANTTGRPLAVVLVVSWLALSGFAQSAAPASKSEALGCGRAGTAAGCRRPIGDHDIRYAGAVRQVSGGRPR